MTDEMLVEAVARALWRAHSGNDAAWDSYEAVRINMRQQARAALAALPPEMLAAAEMKRALAEADAFIHECASAKKGGLSFSELCRIEGEAIARHRARAALALASSPGQQSTKDGEEG